MKTPQRLSHIPLTLALCAVVACESLGGLYAVLKAVRDEFPGQSVQVTRNNDGDLLVALNEPQLSPLDSVAKVALAWRVGVVAARALPLTDSSRTVAVLLWEPGDPSPIPFGDRFSIDSLRAAAPR